MTFQPSNPHAPAAPVARPYGGAGEFMTGAASAGIVALAIIGPTLFLGPFLVKAFKPEWPYKRRLAASLAFGVAVSAIRSIAAAGSKKA